MDKGPVEANMSESYNIRKLDDGTIVVGCMGDKGMKEQAFDTAQDALDFVHSKMGGAESYEDDGETEEKADEDVEDAGVRTNVNKMMKDTEDEE